MISKTEKLKKSLLKVVICDTGTECPPGGMNDCDKCQINQILKACKESGLMFPISSLGATHPHLANYYTFEEIETNE